MYQSLNGKVLLETNRFNQVALQCQYQSLKGKVLLILEQYSKVSTGGLYQSLKGKVLLVGEAKETEEFWYQSLKGKVLHIRLYSTCYRGFGINPSKVRFYKIKRRFLIMTYIVSIPQR